MWPVLFLIGTAAAFVLLLTEQGPQLSGRGGKASGRAGKLKTVKASPKLPPKPPRGMSKRAWTRSRDDSYDLQVEEED